MRAGATSILGWVGVWLFMGCQSDVQPGTLARVGDEEITASDLGKTARLMAKKDGEQKSAQELKKHYLDIVINRRMLVREAEARGLASDPAVVKKKEALHDARLQEKLYRMEVLDKLPRTHEEWHQEMHHAYHTKKLGRTVQGAHILVETEAEARTILQELKGGRDFAEIAKARSLDRETGEHGGLIKGFYRREAVARVLGEELVSLPIGAVAGPIERPNGYDIVKFVEEGSVPFEEVAEAIYRDLRGEKILREQEKFLARIRDSLHVQLLPEGLALLVAQVAEDQPTPPPENLAVPVYQYDGGSVSVGQCLKGASDLQTGDEPIDDEHIEAIVERRVLFYALLLPEARRRKMDRQPEFTEWLQDREEELMMERLRDLETAAETAVTREEMEQFYIEHRDWYALPDAVQLVEILLPTEEQADSLLAKIKAGTTLEELAATHSIRPKAEQTNGHLHIHQYEESVYQQLYQAAIEAPLGQVMGPLKVAEGYFPGGYSIFKAMEKSTAQIPPFEEVQPKVKVHVRFEKTRRRFEDFLNEMRQKYQVEIFEKNLQAMTLDQPQG